VLALLRLAVLDLAAPGAALLVAVLDQLLEPLEITAHLTLDHAEKVARDVLRPRLPLDVNLDVDARSASSGKRGWGTGWGRLPTPSAPGSTASRSLSRPIEEQPRCNGCGYAEYDVPDQASAPVRELRVGGAAPTTGRESLRTGS
jgi:hypothetical protein